jgi:hypothetical protein
VKSHVTKHMATGQYPRNGRHEGVSSGDSSPLETKGRAYQPVNVQGRVADVIYVKMKK